MKVHILIKTEDIGTKFEDTFIGCFLSNDKAIREKENLEKVWNSRISYYIKSLKVIK